MSAWDAFISHAWEDKEVVARPLANALKQLGAKVWYDEFELGLGDSLNKSISLGLAQSRFGVVILSHHFFAKHWSMLELNGLAARESEGHQVILPVWHGLKRDEVARYSPILADRIAAATDSGIPAVATEIARKIRRPERAESTPKVGYDRERATNDAGPSEHIREPKATAEALSNAIRTVEALLADAQHDEDTARVRREFLLWRRQTRVLIQEKIGVERSRGSLEIPVPNSFPESFGNDRKALLIYEAQGCLDYLRQLQRSLA